jgi:hypothetical protein
MPAVDPVSAALSAGQTALGIVQSISGAAKAKRLLQQRTAYKTPEEYYDILNATQNRAQGGFDAFTLNYLTNQTDRAFDSGLNTATRLGADPNQLSALFDQKIQATMKIGAENARLNMDNFSRYLGALDVIGQNKTAEWSSEQDILKDKLQAANADKQAGLQNIVGGANALTANISAGKTANLYSDRTDMLRKAGRGVPGGAGAGALVGSLYQ